MSQKNTFFYFLFNIIRFFKLLIFNFYLILLKFSNFSFIYIKIFNNLLIKKYLIKKLNILYVSHVSIGGIELTQMHLINKAFIIKLGWGSGEPHRDK
jgi:hypothetical protein